MEYALGRPEWVASSFGHPIEPAAGTVAVRVVFTFSDRARTESRAVVQSLQSWDLAPILLSGDRRPVVAGLAAELGIAEFHAEARPEDKFAYLRGHPAAAMVGDGVNDAAGKPTG